MQNPHPEGKIFDIFNPLSKSHSYSPKHVNTIQHKILHSCGKEDIDSSKMNFSNLFSLLIVFLSMLSFLSLNSHAADPIQLNQVCANNTFSPNSIYQSNLNSFLSSISSNATQNLKFYNTTSGQNISEPVYGLYDYRGNVTIQVCRTCVVAAVKEIRNKCSREKIAVIWYDECLLRYSNRSFFSTMDEKPKFGLLNTQNFTNDKFELFNKLLSTTMIDLAREASLNVPIGKRKFGTKQVIISAFQTLYC